MLAEINPVLLKELRQRFRSGKTVWLLALYLLVIGAFILGFMYLNWRNSPGMFQPNRSREFFMLLSTTQLFLLAFVTPGLTAGVISGEREKQTLNVLLTTRLTPWQIIWSKLASSSAFMVLLIFAALPLYSIIFLYGGIAPEQVLGIFGFYLVTMYLFSCIGIVCSTFFKRTGASTITAYGLAFALSAGTGFLAAFLYEIDHFRRLEEWTTAIWSPGFIPYTVEFLQDINPVFVLMKILGQSGIPTDVSFGIHYWTVPYWGIYTAFYLVAGTLLLYRSSRMLHPHKNMKSWQNRPGL